MLEFSDKVAGSYVIKASVTEQDVADVMVAALEGGIGYWAQLDNTGSDWKKKPKGEPLSTWAAKLLLDGNAIKFTDAETGDDEEWLLTLEKLVNGIKLNHERRPDHSDKDCWDALDADCIVQFALFGEVVFG